VRSVDVTPRPFLTAADGLGGWAPGRHHRGEPPAHAGRGAIGTVVEACGAGQTCWPVTAAILLATVNRQK
jgi:hypothetical protein